MTHLKNKIDFMVTVQVKNANPNGDPLAGNEPRTNLEGYGIISDVAIKRKIRNRMQDLGHKIFVQSKERVDDDYLSLKARYEAHMPTTKKEREEEAETGKMTAYFCDEWLDVKTFGQVIAYEKGISVGIRGPVSIAMAESLSPVHTQSMQITRSVVGSKPADTMGRKPYIDYGVYLIKGSINPFFAEKTGFSEEDAEVVKEALRTLFVNDASSARPEGSMEVKEIFWFTHPTKLGQVSSAKVFDLLEYNELGALDARVYEDYEVRVNDDGLDNLKEKGVTLEIIEGL